MSDPQDLRTPVYRILIAQLVILDNGKKALIFKRPHHKEIEPILVEDLYAMIEGLDFPSRPNVF